MTRLPSHWSTYPLPEKATAHTVPSVATSVPHILNPRPPLPPAATTLVSAVLRDCQLGNAQQSASAGPARIEKSALVKNEGTHFWMDIAPLPSSDGKKRIETNTPAPIAASGIAVMFYERLALPVSQLRTG